MDAVDVHARWLIAALIYGVAYLVAVAVFWSIAKRRAMATGEMLRIMGAGLIGGLAGANLVQLIATGLPGKTIEGGIAGGWLAVVLMKRHLGYTLPTGDLFSLAIPAGEAIGRIGCFIGGCCYGKIASGIPWAVHDHGAWRHPTQLYLLLLAATSFGILTYAERRLRLPPNGLFYAGGMLFCIDRFIVEFFRDVSATSLGLTLGQLGCMAGFAVFAWKFAAIVASRAISSAAE